VPITKHNYHVQSVEEIPYVIKEAFPPARSGRPGPVLIDVTKDAQPTRAIPRWDRPLRLPRHESAGVLDRGAVERATALLVGAARPLIMAGNGVIQHGDSERMTKAGALPRQRV
jgi:acetolactate synthase I/II/III large subunit